MKNKDQISIYESYRDDILSRFKKSVKPSENNNGNNSPNDSERDNIEIDKIDIKSDDGVPESEPLKKKNVIIRSPEVSMKLDPNLREIVRLLPNIIEDIDILKLIKKAIHKVNDDLSEFDQKIEDSPLSVYDQLMDAGVYSEEEIMEDDDRLNPAESSGDLDDDTLTVDDYFDDDDFSGESDFNLSKETQKERGDFKSGMRKDVERSKAEDILRQMGVDFDSNRDYDDEY
jgi:hypothetical protein